MCMLFWGTIKATSADERRGEDDHHDVTQPLRCRPLNPVKSCSLPTSTTASETTTEVAT